MGEFAKAKEDPVEVRRGDNRVGLRDGFLGLKLADDCDIITLLPKRFASRQ